MRHFSYLLPILFLVVCNVESDNAVSNTYEETKWTNKSQKVFISKCLNSLDSATCFCVLSKIIDSQKDIEEIGKMKHNEFLGLAADCNGR